MSAASSLKYLLYNFFSKLLQGHYLQQLASVAVAASIGVTLLNYFENLLTELKGDFNDLQSLDFWNYLAAFIDLSQLDVGLTNILMAMGFAIVWRFTYDLKPQIKTGGG